MCSGLWRQYDLTTQFLGNIKYNNYCSATYASDCSLTSHKAAINEHYTQIVNALKHAEIVSIPRIPCNAPNPFWNEPLEDLKLKFILWPSI